MKLDPVISNEYPLQVIQNVKLKAIFQLFRECNVDKMKSLVSYADKVLADDRKDLAALGFPGSMRTRVPDE